MKHYEITTITFIVIGIATLVAGLLASDVFHETPSQVSQTEETVLKTGLEIAASAWKCF